MQVWDYAVFAATLLASTAIGFYYAFRGDRQRTNREFLMADRQMSIFPVSMSLLASFLSAITMLGTASELYFYGTMYWMVALSYVVAIAVTSTVFIPTFYDMGLTSAYEYLEKRFHKSVRIVASFSSIVQMTIFLGIVLYAPALALEAVTEIPWSHSVLVLGFICTLYTTLGGMKAVMWTDVLQIGIMFGGMLTVVACGCWQMGGLGRIFSIAKSANRLEFFNFDVNPLKRHSVWSLVLGGSVTWLVIYGSNQSQVQSALWLNLPGLIVLLFLCGLAGLVAYARYRDCDPLSMNLINKNDQILPFYVIDNFGHIPGFTGLFVASIFSGAMSTLSSGVNALVTVTLEDFIKPYSKIKSCTGNNDSAFFSKLLVVGYGTLVIMIALVASTLGNLIQACFSLFGSIGGPVMATFLLGTLCPCATWKGALSGLVFGEVMSIYQAIGSYVYRRPSATAPLSMTGCLNETGHLFLNHNFTNMNQNQTSVSTVGSRYDFDLYHISYMYHGVWAVAWTLAVAIVVSLISKACNSRNHFAIQSRKGCNPFTYPLTIFSSEESYRIMIIQATLMTLLVSIIFDPGAFNKKQSIWDALL